MIIHQASIPTRKWFSQTWFESENGLLSMMLELSYPGHYFLLLLLLFYSSKKQTVWPARKVRWLLTFVQVLAFTNNPDFIAFFSDYFAIFSYFSWTIIIFMSLDYSNFNCLCPKELKWKIAVLMQLFDPCHRSTFWWYCVHPHDSQDRVNNWRRQH